ncbi:O-antigen ligase family protein [Paenibacillus sp. KQZ6P-2]|uniref:O-antigen ligase family protein n=1 Tax=Paenibacillus mangrovi TaxID=2931978 RepID=A0A9X1WSA2_9BACL|nr:O-antigen ligase family protein [Paenibacillus mangrovi]MCJ8012688.1 O-antigen ligase family protein [Paenibacillus mangrovi]
MSNPVYGKQAKRSSNVEKKPVQFWLLIVALIAFLVWTPFQVALFNGQMLEFEKPLFLAIALSSILLFLWISNYYKSFKLAEQRDWLPIAVLLLPITYLLSYFGAASHYLAMNMVLIECLYAIMFIISVYLLQDRRANSIIQTTIMTVAYLIVGFGFLNWFGHGKLAGSLVGWFSSAVLNGKYTDAVMTDSNGLRLTSVFQYANTYAAFLMAFLFAAVFCLIRSKKWYGQAIHAFMLVPIILSLLLTLSRGGLVMLPVVFVILLLFLKPAKQILWFVYCAIAGVASLAISKEVTDLGLQLNQKFEAGVAVKGWAYLLVVSAIVAVLGWGIQAYLAPKLEQGLAKASARKMATLWVPIGSTIVIGVLAFLLIGTNVSKVLPENISTRLDTINLKQHSVLERITFYKDGMKVVKDYPVLGAGGGAWAALYEKYQNNPYTSRQAHNFYVQYLLEVGIVGFTIFMAFILFIFYKYIRGYFKTDEEGKDSYFLYFILTLSILVHSVMDFNMSYVFIGMLVFIGLGGMAAAMDSQPLRKLSWKAESTGWIYSLVVGICGVVVLITSTRYVQASSAGLEAKKVSQTSTSYEEIKAPLDKDLAIRPNHPDSVLLMSSLYQSVYKQTQNDEFYNAAQSLLTDALKKEPYNKNMIIRLMNNYQLKNENDKAYELLVANAPKFNWDIEWYEKMIVQGFELGYTAMGNGDTASKDKYFKDGINAFEKVQAGLKHLATLPKEQMAGRPFANSPMMILDAGKMYYMTNQPDKAAETLKMGLQQDLSDPTNREIAHWYVAAMQKQGSNDQAVLDQLIKVDPSEKEQIAKLVQINF